MTVLFCFEFTKINLLLHVIFEKYRLCPLEGAIDTFMFLFFFFFFYSYKKSNTYRLKLNK